MEKTWFHVDVNSAFLSWSALKALREGGTLDLRTVPSAVGGDEEKRHGVVLAKSTPAKNTASARGNPSFPPGANARNSSWCRRISTSMCRTPRPSSPF